MEQPFKLPDDDASNEQRQAALDALNAIRITGDQLQRAFALNPRFSWNPEGEELRSFCRQEGLLPVDVAACAMAFRLDPLQEAYFEGDIDVPNEPLAYFEAFARGPIHATYVDLYPKEAETV